MGESDEIIRETHIIHANCRERLLPLDAGAAGALKACELSMAGISDLRTEYRIGRRSPRYHVLLATLGGSGSLQTSAGTTRLMPGSLLLLPAMTSYVYRLCGRGWRILWYHLRASTSRWKTLAGKPWEVREGVSLQQMESAAEGLLSETSRLEGGTVSSKAERNRIITLQAELLAALLERELRPFLNGRASGAEDNPADAALRRRLEAVWSEVDNALHLPWDVAQLARLAHMSPGHFHRVTGRLMGMTPMEHVTQLRLARARALLVSTDMPAYQIAAQVGYENPFAFSTAFKRHVGKSPRDFRLRALQGEADV